MKKKTIRSFISYILILSMLLVPFSQTDLQVNAAENETKIIQSISLVFKTAAEESPVTTFYETNETSSSPESLDEDDLELAVTYSDSTSDKIELSNSEYVITNNINEVRAQQGKDQELKATLTYKDSEGNDVPVESTDNPTVTILPAKTTYPSKVQLKLKEDNKTTFYAADGVLGKDDTLDLEDVNLIVTFITKTPKNNYFELTDEEEKYDETDSTETIALPLENEERFTVTTNIEDVRSKVGNDQTLTAELKYLSSKIGNTETYTTIKSSDNDPADDPKVNIVEPSKVSKITAIQLKLKDADKKFYADNGLMSKDDTFDLDDLELVGIYEISYSTNSTNYDTASTEEKTLSFSSEDYKVTTNVDVIRKLIGKKQEVTAELTYKDTDGKNITIKTLDSATVTKENASITDNSLKKKATTVNVTIEAPKAINGVLTVSPQNYASASHNSKGTNANDIYTDKAEIQNALDLASADYKLVVNFPAGTYYIGGSLYIHSNTTMKLADGAVIKRNSNNDDATTRTGRDGVNHNLLKVSPYNSNTTNTAGKYSNGENIIIEGGTFDGGNISVATSASNVFNLGHINNLTIKNTTIKNAYGNHLIEIVGVQNAEISGCTFTGFRYVTSQITDDDGTISYSDSNGDLAEAIQIDVAHKDSKSAWTSAYLTDDTPCANINIHDNTFTDYPVAVGNHHALAGHHHTNINVSNNIITGSKSMNTGINLYGCDNSSASGNTITQYAAGIRVRASQSFTVSNNNISTATYGVIETETSSGQIVSNTINSISNQGITIYGSGTTASTVSQNIISNSSGNGIHINVSASCDTISNNTISQCTSSGIKVYGSGKVTTLTSNTIKNCQASGIEVYGSASVPSITKNTINSCNGSGIYVYSSASAKTIKSNKISNCNKYGVYVTGKASVKTLSSNTITDIKKNGIYVKNDKIKITFKSNKLTRVGSTAIKINSKLSSKKTQKYTFAPKVISLNLAGGVMTTQASNLKKIKLKVGSKSYTKSTKKKNYTFSFKKYTKEASSATVTFTDKNKNTVARVLDFE